MNTPKVQLLISDNDQKILYAILNHASGKDLSLLEEELSKARVLPKAELPPDVVSLRSFVRVRDLDSGDESQFQLVLPHEADVTNHKISVLVPMGMAVIGLSAGQEYRWLMPGGRAKHFQIVSSRREI